ncbi:hypothetical protein HZB02_06775 [Candidatus Woesearchaeota archaeon]|nr:hypothetical protein [Candidatus Woesearchaeota archaeon]
MKSSWITIQDAKSPVLSHQCPKCSYFDFDGKTMEKAISEIKAKETALKMKQKIIKLSHNRLGIYLNKDVARTLHLKGGEEVLISVPDKHKLVVELGN